MKILCISVSKYFVLHLKRAHRFDFYALFYCMILMAISLVEICNLSLAPNEFHNFFVLAVLQYIVDNIDFF